MPFFFYTNVPHTSAYIKITEGIWKKNDCLFSRSPALLHTLLSSVDLGFRVRICISNKFLGNAHGVGHGITVWEPVLQRKNKEADFPLSNRFIAIHPSPQWNPDFPGIVLTNMFSFSMNIILNIYCN